MNNMFDRIIIGAGIYGLYSAYRSAEKGYTVLVLDRDPDAYSRGSLINQARLHSGYHYPRSKSTAIKSRDYFFKFMNDFGDAINTEFKQYYAISHTDSLTTRDDFIKFCTDLGIKCDEIDSSPYFKPNMVDGLFDTLEYSIDPFEMREILLARCAKYGNKIQIKYNSCVSDINYKENMYTIHTTSGDTFTAQWVLNATYASTNQILNMLNLPTLNIKYEKCEVNLCAVSAQLKDIGLTVMDGPFFSIMPFGNTGLHSITSVCYTPHETSYDITPQYECQNKCDQTYCNAESLGNCNTCKFSPVPKVDVMIEQAKKYLVDGIRITPIKSLFTIKPILNSCEKDDARPTLINKYEQYPNFYTVFSGKLNTMYDLDGIL